MQTASHGQARGARAGHPACADRSCCACYAGPLTLCLAGVDLNTVAVVVQHAHHIPVCGKAGRLRCSEWRLLDTAAARHLPSGAAPATVPCLGAPTCDQMTASAAHPLVKWTALQMQSSAARAALQNGAAPASTRTHQVKVLGWVFMELSQARHMISGHVSSSAAGRRGRDSSVSEKGLCLCQPPRMLPPGTWGHMTPQSRARMPGTSEYKISRKQRLCL